jgi:hypothetical protein
MPATQINRSTRYFAPGNLVAVWVPTIAATNFHPTRVEINAGTAINCEIAAIDGFTQDASFVETPDLCSNFVPKLFSRFTVPDSSITFWADIEGDDIRTILTPGLAGFLVLMDAGDVEDRLMDVWPSSVGGLSKSRDVSGQSATQIKVSFSITALPALDVAVPAAA